MTDPQTLNANTAPNASSDAEKPANGAVNAAAGQVAQQETALNAQSQDAKASSKRRGRKANKDQQTLPLDAGGDQSGTGAKAAEEAKAGGGNGVLYAVGGLALLGAGVAAAGGGGSDTPAPPPPPADTTPPELPTLSFAADTGSSTTDRVTSNGRINVGALETGATWEFSTNSGTTWQAGTGSNFTLAAGTYADGAVQVRQKDAAGNVSAVARISGAVVIDATAPSGTTIAQVAGDGTVSAAEKAAGVTVSGTAEAGSSVAIVWGGVTKTVTASATGAWSANFAASEVPADGATKVSVTVTDLAGNASVTVERDVTVDTRLTVSGQIVAGPLVAGHELTVDIYGSDGKLLKSAVAVDNTGAFSTLVAAKVGDVLIARLNDGGPGADYLDEATGATTDLSANLFAAVTVTSLSAPTTVQVNPLTTIAAIKAGLAADGTGTIASEAALNAALVAVAKAFGVVDLQTAPIAANSAGYAPADGLSNAEKLGAMLAALSGVDAVNGGDAQKTIVDLAAAISVSGQSLSASGLALLIAGAAAADVQIAGSLQTAISDLLERAPQTSSVTISAIAVDNIISAAEKAGLKLEGNVAEGATAVNVAVGELSFAATITGTTWSYTLSNDDVAALGADGAKVVVATATFASGTNSISRPVILDTAPPAAVTIADVSVDNKVNAAEKAAGVTVSGKSEPSSDVVVTWGSVERGVRADSSGNWTLTFAAADIPSDGATSLSARAVDLAGNVGATATLPVSIDTSAPGLPTIDAISRDDIVTAPERTSSVVITGTAEANATIALRWGDGAEVKAKADVDGIWSITVPAENIPAPGQSNVVVRAIDAAGNAGPSATRTTTIFDTVAAPRIFTVSSDDVVNATEGNTGVSVRGLAPANGLIRLTWGSTAVIVQADPNGDWSAQFALGDLPVDGRSELIATLINANGTAIAEATRAITIDTTAPLQATFNAVATNNVINLAEKSASVEVSGTAEAGADLRLTWGGVTRTVKVGENGQWTTTYAPNEVPADGSTQIEARVVDAVGNTSLATNRPVVIDTVVPVKPNAQLAADTGSSATDLVTSNGTVQVQGIEAGSTWEYSTDAGDNWATGSGTSFALQPDIFAAEQILIRQTDAAGNVSLFYSNPSPITVDKVADAVEISAQTSVNLAQKTAGVVVRGSFEDSGTVVVTWGGVSKTTTANTLGQWEVVFVGADVPADGTRLITALGTDVAGNTRAAPAFAVDIDTGLPIAPSLTLVADTGSSTTDGVTNNGDVVVAGLEAGASWEYSLDAGATWRAGSDARFTIAEGSYAVDAIKVRQIDVSGNIGAATSISKALVVDNAARGLAIKPVATDNVINIAERTAGVTITGTAEAGALISVTWGGVVKSATASATGEWSVSYTTAEVPPAGVQSIAAFQTDIAGNVSSVVNFPVTVDLTPPAAPIIATIATDNIVNGAAKAAGVTVSGTTVANGKVLLNWGATEKTVDADANGAWSAVFSAAEVPADGSTTLTAKVTNGVGNVSEAAPKTVTIDTVVAPPTVATVSADGRINASEKAAGITVSGLAEANATVTLQWGSVTRTATANGSGQWSANFAGNEVPADGATTITVSQKDAVGNVSTAVQVPVSVDTVAPNVPTIGAVQGDDIITAAEKAAGVRVSGLAEANAQVTVNLGGSSQTVNADGLGNWSATFASAAVPADGDRQVTVTARDIAGNISGAATRLITVATGTITAPVIAVVAADNMVSAAEKTAGVRVSGVATASSSVAVTWGAVTKTVVANAQGSWTASFSSADIPADGTYNISATAGGFTGTRSVVVDATPAPTPLLTIAAAAMNEATALAGSGAVTVSAQTGTSVSVTFVGANSQSVVKTFTATGSAQPVVLTSADLALLGNGNVTVSASASTPGTIGSLSSPASASFVIDTVTPASPTIFVTETDNIVDLLEKAQGTQISGTAEGNAVVTVNWGGISKTTNAAANGSWSVTYGAADVPADGTRVASVTARDAAGNVSTAALSTIHVEATPMLAITKAASITASAEMFGISETATASSSVLITLSGVANGEFRVAGTAATQFSLADVNNNLVTFVHDGSNAAPAYSVSVSDGVVSSSTVAANVFFMATDLGNLTANTSIVAAGAGPDHILIGGFGNDTLTGGPGNDILYGQNNGTTATQGNDSFVWQAGDAGTGARDVVRDFEQWNGTSGDVLNVQGLLQGTTPGADLSQWISVQTNTTAPGLGAYDAARPGTLITIDVDGPGSGTVTQSIFLTGVNLSTTNVSQLVSSGVIIA